MSTQANLQQTVKIRIICVSDTHNHSPGSGFTLPQGDILIHAGDLTNEGTHGELQKAATWLAGADFQAQIVAAGNHDFNLYPTSPVTEEVTRESRAVFDRIPGLVYLQHSGTTIQLRKDDQDVELRVFGSPYSKAYPGRHCAFQYSEDQAEGLWSAIPNKTDILVTHTPPAGLCDESQQWTEGGCLSLRQALRRVRPAIHVCGHSHEGRGAKVVTWCDNEEAYDPVASTQKWQDPGIGNKKLSLLDLTGKRGAPFALQIGHETAVVNASIMARSYGAGKAFNKPIVIDVNLPVASQECS